MRLRWSEWITIAYFVYLATAAAVFPGGQRRRVVAVAVAVVSAVLAISRFSTLAVLRDWMPLAYVVLGYWLPALLVTNTTSVFERTLLELDRRWLGAQGAMTIRERAPRPMIEAFELAYLFCYPMVPIGFGSLYAAGLRDETDKFWTAVVLAVFGCYGVLPWLPTRPPRAIEGEPASPGVIRRLNLQMLGRASIQLNTFPSGHAAASAATALAVGARLPAVGLALGLLAAGIAVGSVVGRYHYAADALAGVLLGLVGFMISRLV